MKTFNYLILSTAFMAASTTAKSWKALSREAQAMPNVMIPQGTYTVRCNDHGKANGLWLAYRESMWRNVLSFGLLGVPFYYIFSKGLLELSPRTAVEFEIEHTDAMTNAFTMKLPESSDMKNKYVSEKKLQKESRASFTLAKPGPSYDASNDKVFEVYLRMMSSRSDRRRWFRAGRRRWFSNRRKLRMAHNKMSQWTLIQKSLKELPKEDDFEAAGNNFDAQSADDFEGDAQTTGFNDLDTDDFGGAQTTGFNDVNNEDFHRHNDWDQSEA